MATSQRQWVQCELKLLPGAEPWVMVRHRNGCFKLPLDAPLSEAIQGVVSGWKLDRRKYSQSEATVRIPLSTFLAEWARFTS